MTVNRLYRSSVQQNSHRLRLLYCIEDLYCLLTVNYQFAELHDWLASKFRSKFGDFGLFWSVDFFRKIKIVATRCRILRLKCTKFNFGRGSAPDPAGGAYSAPPDPLAEFKGPTSKGREGEGRDSVVLAYTP